MCRQYEDEDEVEAKKKNTFLFSFKNARKQEKRNGVLTRKIIFITVGTHMLI